MVVSQFELFVLLTVLTCHWLTNPSFRFSVYSVVCLFVNIAGLVNYVFAD